MRRAVVSVSALGRLPLGCLIGRLFGLMLVGGLLRLFIADPAVSLAVRRASGGVALVVLVAYAYARARDRAVGRVPFAAFASGLCRTAWRCAVACFDRTSAPVREPGVQPLGYLKSGSYDAVFVLVLIALVVEIPIDVLLIELVFKMPAALASAVHGAVLVSSVVGLVLWLGDRRQIGRGEHGLAPDALLIQLGARAQARMARSQLINVRRLSREEASRLTAPCHRRAPDHVNLALYAKPNVELELQDHHTMTWFGAPRQVRKLLLNLDDPTALERWFCGEHAERCDGP